MGRLRESAGALSLDHLWPALVLTLVFAVTSAMPVAQADFWWHVVVGESIATGGTIPAVDTFSHTRAGEPYPSYRSFWLMDLVLYAVHRLGGPVLVSAGHALALTATCALVLWAAWRVSGSWRAASLATLVTAETGFFSWNVRPQTAAFLLAAVIIVAAVEHRRSRHPAWVAVVPLAMILWVNSHGTFPIGLAILGLWFVAELGDQVAALRASDDPPTTGLTHAGIALVLGALATLANPGGAWWIGYVHGMTGNAAVQGVSEWMPVDPGTPHGVATVTAVLLVAVVLIRSRRRAGPAELLAFLVFAALAIRYGRGGVWFGMVLAPVLALHLTLLRPVRSGDRPAARTTPREARFTAGGLAVLAGLAVVVSTPVRTALADVDVLAPDTPVAATDFLLAEAPPGPLFNSQHFGSYLTWAAQPEYPVFIDSRVELFPDELWEDYQAISAGRWDWEDSLERYRIRTLMLQPEFAHRLVAAAGASPNWVELYRDETAVIFTRR